jgi:hypothetical protein
LANIINGTDTGSGGLITTGDSSDELQIQTAETTAVTITSGQQSAFIAGTAAAPAVTTTGDLNTGIYFPAADNIGFATGGTIRGRWTTDGLCFGSDTAAGNALDDYEEGTWTPTVIGSTTAGTATYSSQVGSYTKIGRVVQIVGFCAWSSGTGTGPSMRIEGLPFTVLSSANADDTPCSSQASDIATDAGTFIAMRFRSNTTQVGFVQQPVGNGSIGNAAYDAAGNVYFAGTYITAT